MGMIPLLIAFLVGVFGGPRFRSIIAKVTGGRIG